MKKKTGIALYLLLFEILEDILKQSIFSESTLFIVKLVFFKLHF